MNKEMCHKCKKYPAEYNQTECEFCLGISSKDEYINNLKQALNEIREYVNSDKLLNVLCEPKINIKGETHYDLIRQDILQIADKVLGDDDKCI